MNSLLKTTQPLIRLAVLFVGFAFNGSAAASPLKSTIEALDANPQEIERTIQLHESIAARRSSLSRDVVEHTLQRAQENIIRKSPELAYRQLLRLTLAHGFTTHPGRAAVYYWMGRSLMALDMPTAALENFEKSLKEPRQTQSARLSTLVQIAIMNPKLDAGVAEHYYRQALTLSKDRFPNFRTYQFCKLLYHSQSMKLAEACFNQVDTPEYDQSRALFFQSVIAIRTQRLREATLKLEASLNLSHRNIMRSKQNHDENDPKSLADGELPLLNVESWGAFSSQAIQPTTTEWQALNITTHLALARVAAHRQKWQLASTHYRHIPPGHPDYFKASEEWAICLRHLGEFRRAATVLSSVAHAQRSQAPMLRSELWRADLLSQAGQFERSQALYGHLAKHLEQDRNAMKQGTVVEQATRQSKWLLESADLSVPRIDERLQALEHELVQSQQQLQQLTKAVADANQKADQQPLFVELEHRIQRARQNGHLNGDQRELIKNLRIRLTKLKVIERRQRHWLKLRLPKELSKMSASALNNETTLNQLAKEERSVRVQLGQEVDRLMDSMDFHLTMSPAMQSIYHLQIVKQTRTRLALELSAEQKWLQSNDP